MDKMARIVNRLLETGAAPSEYRLHRLSGDMAGYWECHIEPDWLLVYKVDDDTVLFARTGTHSDIF